jgi:transcriptional regulator with XRE-family HTH domain
VTTTEELERTLGFGIRALRVARRLTQIELAERANLSPGAVKHLETGAGATTTTLVKVLRALDAESWLETVAPPPAPFDPLQLLEDRERQARRSKGPSRVRQKRGAES